MLSRAYGQNFLISEMFVVMTVKTKCWDKHLQTFYIELIFILVNTVLISAFQEKQYF